MVKTIKENNGNIKRSKEPLGLVEIEDCNETE